ncbi:hypothetical protein CDAR_446451 [Caerostris darwini]|uniref:Uncharacterized protein n=1 Tax=Caerostris darwini TaxID=1538125 RepID=A0AAV4SVS3_9ARAC|nr:hypothetical protein CDAR_446451 [Caerostris darwini]
MVLSFPSVRGLRCIAVDVKARHDRIACMQKFAQGYPKQKGYPLPLAVHLCGFYADSSDFGRKQGDPQNPAPKVTFSKDLDTNKTCSYSRYKPGVKEPPAIEYVPAEAWTIGMCSVEKAKLSYANSKRMFEVRLESSTLKIIDALLILNI